MKIRLVEVAKVENPTIFSKTNEALIDSDRKYFLK